MIEASRRKEVLSRAQPHVLWNGEPKVGSVYGEEEIAAAVKAMREAEDVTQTLAFANPIVKQFEDDFAAYVGSKHAITMNSAGPALDMSIKFLNPQPGDEFIVPAINFIAAPMAILGQGAQIVWCEVDPKTLQMDPADVEKKITSRTRAVMPVHMNGLASPLDEIQAVVDKHSQGKIAVIADAARACGGSYKGKKLGGPGPLLTVFSFQSLKSISTLGEGGMVTTDSDELDQFLRRVRFYGAQADSGVWGSSYVMNKVQAAVGIEQLKKLDSFVAARRKLAATRDAYLSGVPELTLPYEPADCTHSYYLYTCILPESWRGAKRDALLKTMLEKYKFHCVVANPPCYKQRTVLRDATIGQELPLSDSLGERLFCLPLHPAMTDDDNEFISAAVIETIEELR